MSKGNEKYRLLIENMMDGFAYHQIVRDSSGTPVDYIFLDVNPAFEAMTGLARDDILGKAVTEVLSGIKESSYDWIGVYGQVANTGKPIRFESFSKTLSRWYEVSAYSAEYGHFAAIFRDITENKKMKEALSASETRYRRLFESAKDGILILEAETGRIMNVNPFLVELLGYSEEEILGKNIWKIGTFKDILANQDNFLELQQKEYIRKENLMIQTADGREVVVEFVSNVYLESGQKLIQCNIRDITDRKRSEVYQALIGEVLAILNESGDFHDAIQRVLSTVKSATGLDAVGMRLQKGEDFPYYAQDGFFDDFISEENALVTRTPEGEIYRNSDGSIRLECTCGLVISGKTDPTNPLLTPGGSCWTNNAGEDPQFDPQNQCTHQGYASIALVPISKNKEIIGILQLNDRRKDQFNRDAINTLEEIEGHISEALARKHMEESLRESEQKMNDFLNNITDVIWSVSLPEMNLFYVSPSAEKMYGLSAEEFVKNPSLWPEVIHPDDQHLVEKAYAQLYEKGETVMECRIVRPDGSIVWICDKFQLIYDEKHVPMRIEGIASDITSRKQAEESLKKRLNELESIYAISSTLRTAETLDEMQTLLLGETLKVLDTTSGAICLYDPAEGQLGFTTTRGWVGSLDDVFLKPGEGLVGEVFASGKALASREYAKDSRVKYQGKMPEGWGGVCLPLRAEADVMGVLVVSVPLPREITSEELKLLTSLAEMAGTAVHRISLFEKNLHHLEQLQALRNIDMAISGSLDLRVTFRVILDEVTRMLNVDAAAILRLDPHTGMLKYEAWRGFRIANPAKLSLSIGEGLAGQAAMDRRSVQVVDLRDIEEEPVQLPFLKKEEAHSYYAVPLINKGRVEGVLEIFHREPLDASNEWMEFLETLAGQTAIAIDNAELIHNMANTNLKLTQAYDKTLAGWARALDLRDKDTEHHSQRVTEMTVTIARVMGLSQEELVQVRRGSLLHDIGKMGIPDSILLKPGPLTDEEWTVMHLHPVYAFEMLSPIEYLRPALDIPYCHHEKWDGTGYPRGLKGEEIPISARIFAIADVHDALTSDRPYRKAWSREKTLDHILQGSGSHFDPQVVELFLKEVDIIGF